MAEPETRPGLRGKAKSRPPEAKLIRGGRRSGGQTGLHRRPRSSRSQRRRRLAAHRGALLPEQEQQLLVGRSTPKPRTRSSLPSPTICRRCPALLNSMRRCWRYRQPGGPDRRPAVDVTAAHDACRRRCARCRSGCAARPPAEMARPDGHRREGPAVELVFAVWAAVVGGLVRHQRHACRRQRSTPVSCPPCSRSVSTTRWRTSGPVG